MARSRRKSKRRRSGGSALGVFLVLLTLALLGGLGYLRFTVSPEKLDASTLCPTDGPLAQLAILLDMTDPISFSQLSAARARIENEVDKAGPGTRISLALVSPDPNLQGRVRLTLCKPRSGEKANALYENPQMIASKFENEFVTPLDAALNEMLSTGVSKTSPIMESIQAFVSSTPDFLAFKGPRKLVIFSDLIQHGELMSFYRGQDWSDLENSNATARFARSLNDTDILILRIPRPNTSVEKVDDFWSRYFDVQGAATVRVFTIGDL